MYRKYIPPKAKMVPPQAKCAFEGVIYSTWQWEQEMFDGSHATFEMLKRSDTVEIIPIIGDKVLIQQEEQPYHGKFIDIPGGMHDYDGEDELKCAQRELAEETGYELSEWKLVTTHQFDGKIERFFYIFVAFGEYKKVEQNLDVGEKVAPELVDFDEFMRIAPTLRSYGSIRDIIKGARSAQDLISLPDLYSS